MKKVSEKESGEYDVLKADRREKLRKAVVLGPAKGENKMSLAVWQFREHWRWEEGNYKQLLTFQEAWWCNACYASSVQYKLGG